MLHEKLEPLSVAAVPLQVALATPESASEREPDTNSEDDETMLPSVGEAIDKSGELLSILTTIFVVAELPALSVTVPVIICPKPSLEIVSAAGQLAMGKVPCVQVNVTTTLELFQTPVGAGETVAEIDGATITVKLTPLLARPAAITTIFPVVAPEGTFAMI
jgi:hypothetical protein